MDRLKVASPEIEWFSIRFSWYGVGEIGSAETDNRNIINLLTAQVGFHSNQLVLAGRYISIGIGIEGNGSWIGWDSVAAHTIVTVWARRNTEVKNSSICSSRIADIGSCAWSQRLHFSNLNGSSPTDGRRITVGIESYHFKCNIRIVCTLLFLAMRDQLESFGLINGAQITVCRITAHQSIDTAILLLRTRKLERNNISIDGEIGNGYHLIIYDKLHLQGFGFKWFLLAVGSNSPTDVNVIM